jgi:hypothetical protein
VRLLQKSGIIKAVKLIENNKLIQFKKEINGITELFKEDKNDTADLNH